MPLLYVGTEPNPSERSLVQVSELDLLRVMSLVERAKYGSAFRVKVFDFKTEQYVGLADADCGLGCRCALRYVPVEETDADA